MMFYAFFPKVFQGNKNSYEVAKAVFKQVPVAQHFRIWPLKFSVHPCLRIELYGNKSKSQGGWYLSHCFA